VKLPNVNKLILPLPEPLITVLFKYVVDCPGNGKFAGKLHCTQSFCCVKVEVQSKNPVIELKFGFGFPLAQFGTVIVKDVKGCEFVIVNIPLPLPSTTELFGTQFPVLAAVIVLPLITAQQKLQEEIVGIPVPVFVVNEKVSA
jgi:hypothetical protein